MARDQSPLPVVSAVVTRPSTVVTDLDGGVVPDRPQFLIPPGPSGLGTSAARILRPAQQTAPPDACSGTRRPAIGGEAAQLAAEAPTETVRSVVSALTAASLTEDPAVRRALPEVLDRIQEELRRLARPTSTCP